MAHQNDAVHDIVHVLREYGLQKQRGLTVWNANIFQ